MRYYWSVSQHGKFVFRTDISENPSPDELVSRRKALTEPYSKASGYQVEEYSQPSAWQSVDISY